ncbi:hypothetical protein pEaSNUABM34_00120 [Erwinia phage pEa_SNUABM_34]|nr:hypothetical protein pEaSNUABM34_00120 [Erwinia phage pEa_SNUABM_34]QYW04105.1 hypothetical protein pEaSNUABM46_00121 [Erwinia phage pEa_SNUABM_46]QYW05135.1 hypothetical protein pEaSNUABM21_00121 [Erwinia phage pEa_SNUABM_21]QYW05477.1 hypothetical protein pEaSNUABM25_00121 [Erwinia phage pEa_SNUABM_25]
MGQKAIRLGADLSTGHNGFYPVVAVQASANVMINGKGSVRHGDAYQPHSAPKKPPHVGYAISSSTVRVNGKPAQRNGDPNTCNDTASNGSNNVRFG